MSDMSIISAILVVVVAFLAGLEGILDQFQFHQPLVACTLIGAATGNLTAGIMLGGSLQMIALAWANIGAAVAPDAALASVAAAIILVKGGNFTTEGIGVATATAIPLAVAGLFLTMLVRTASVALVHAADKAAESGNIAGVERAHYLALLLQGLRIAVPAALLLAIPAQSVQHALLVLSVSLLPSSTSTFLNKVAEMVAELQLVLATQSAISWKTTRKGCSHG